MKTNNPRAKLDIDRQYGSEKLVADLKSIKVALGETNELLKLIIENNNSLNNQLDEHLEWRDKIRSSKLCDLT